MYTGCMQLPRILAESMVSNQIHFLTRQKIHFYCLTTKMTEINLVVTFFLNSQTLSENLVNLQENQPLYVLIHHSLH